LMSHLRLLDIPDVVIRVSSVKGRNLHADKKFMK
jgi:hypothetical protein